MKTTDLPHVFFLLCSTLKVLPIKYASYLICDPVGKKGPDAVLPIFHCVVVKFATSHNKNEHLVSYVKSTSHQIYIVPNNIIRLQFLLILRMFMYVLQMCGQVECRLRKGVLWFLP